MVPQPGITSYSLDGEFLQDPNVMTGLSRFLFENDTEEAYFFLGLNGVHRTAESDRPGPVDRRQLRWSGP